MHVGLSLLPFFPQRVGGSEANFRGLINQFREDDSCGHFTVLVNNAAFRDLAQLSSEHLVVKRARLSARGAGFIARAATLAGGLLVPSRLHPDSPKDVDVMHYPLTVPAPRTLGPSVVTLHDLQHHDLPELFTRRQQLWRRKNWDDAARGATVVIAVSRHAKARIVDRLGIDPMRIEVAYHGIDGSHFSSADSGDRQLLSSLDLPDRFVFYPAGLWPHKNHCRLIDALAETTDPELALVLSGPVFDRLPALLAYAERRGVSQRVRHLGFVSRRVVPALYRRARATVFPSLYEGFGSPPLEAMACGCPVAASGSGSLREVCDDAALLFEPRDVRGIASAVDRVVTETNLRADLRAAGYKRAAGFTWKQSAACHYLAFSRALTLY